jgi:protein gp37
MGERSAIEWTDATWNPVRGCTRISEGCRNCYAEGVAARFSGSGQPFEGFADLGRSGSKWTGKVELIPGMLGAPLRWKKPRRIFVNSMSDLFHEALPDEAIDRAFAVMLLAPQHTFQILTKRSDRMRAYLSALVCDDGFRPYVRRPGWKSRDPRDGDRVLLLRDGQTWPLPNVWLGVSVEDQTTADARIPDLLATPAAVRFLSCEPLLGPVDLREWVGTVHHHPDNDPHATSTRAVVRAARAAMGPTIDWAIVGGESGPGARPMHPDWVRSIRDQCTAAGVAFFMKQWGGGRRAPRRASASTGGRSAPQIGGATTGTSASSVETTSSTRTTSPRSTASASATPAAPSTAAPGTSSRRCAVAERQPSPTPSAVCRRQLVDALCQQGLGTRAIARALRISVNTVRTCRQRTKRAARKAVTP